MYASKRNNTNIYMSTVVSNPILQHQYNKVATIFDLEPWNTSNEYSRNFRYLELLNYVITF